MATDSTLVVDVLKTQDLATTVRVEDIGAGIDIVNSLSNTTDVTKGDALIGVKAPYTGATARTQHSKNADTVSVKDFGAVGDGVTDDTASVQAALDSGRSLYFPQGQYVITSQLLKASGPLRIAGAGRPVTTLLWSGSDTAMIKHTPQNGSEVFDLTDFTVICNSPVTVNQYMFWVDSSAQLTTDTYKGMFLVGERELRRGRIHGVDIKPSSTSNGFYGFIRATSTINWSLSDYMFEGAASNWATEGIAVDGDGAVVDIHIYNGWMYNCKNSLYCPDYVEAIYVHDCEWVNVDYGIRSRYVSGRSVLGSTICGSNAVKIGPMHINARVAAVDMVKADYLSADRLLVVLNNSDSPGQLTGFNIEQSIYAAVDRTNIFVTGTGTVLGNAIFGVVGNSCPGLRVHDVITSGCFVNTILLNATVSGSISNLRAANTGSTAVGLQFNSTDCVDNDIGEISAETTRVVNAPSGNRFRLRQYASNINAIVDSTQVVTITVPVYQFSSAPAYASLIARNGANVLASYNLTGSTSTSLVFNITAKGGGTATSGTYGFTLLASEGF